MTAVAAPMVHDTTVCKTKSIYDDITKIRGKINCNSLGLPAVIRKK
jgi:hypothetical protein